VADAHFEVRRLAEIYDPLDPDRSDLDAYAALAGEFASHGGLLLNGQFPLNDQSYRAFTASWTGHPPGRPAVVVRPNPARGSAVHVSWNGATEVETWAVLAGKNPSALVAAGSQPRAGFETVISVNSEGPYFAVTARDASGRQLGRSATVKRTTA
jgi:hypothetical protein